MNYRISFLLFLVKPECEMKHILLLFSFFLFGMTSNAQTLKDDKADLENIVTSFFDALAAGDTLILQDLCVDEMTLMSTYSAKEGVPHYVNEDFQSFLQSVGKPHKEKWEERISNLALNIDDNIAQAWMDYSFFLDDKFSHCGVNAFLFVKTPDGWKISNITDSRRRSCTTIED